jgi:transposase
MTPNGLGWCEALGLDEVLFARIGPFRRQEFSTQIVDVGVGQLLDVVPGRSGAEPTAWLEKQGKEWRDKVRYATLLRITEIPHPRSLKFPTP